MPRITGCARSRRRSLAVIGRGGLCRSPGSAAVATVQRHSAQVRCQARCRAAPATSTMPSTASDTATAASRCRCRAAAGASALRLAASCITAAVVIPAAAAVPVVTAVTRVVARLAVAIPVAADVVILLLIAILIHPFVGGLWQRLVMQLAGAIHTTMWVMIVEATAAPRGAGPSAAAA